MKNEERYVYNSVYQRFLYGISRQCSGCIRRHNCILLGFYDKFIDSIDDLLTGTKEERKDAFVFLIKLGIGWISGFVIAVLILTSVFESHIYYISSLFIGFIIFAIPIVIKEEKNVLEPIKGDTVCTAWNCGCMCHHIF